MVRSESKRSPKTQNETLTNLRSQVNLIENHGALVICKHAFLVRSNQANCPEEFPPRAIQTIVHIKYISCNTHSIDLYIMKRLRKVTNLQGIA